MIIFSLAFLLGDWLLQQQSQLPTSLMLLSLFMLIIIFFIIIKNNICRLIIIGCSVGFIYAAIYAAFVLQHRISEDVQGKILLVEGYISSIPHQMHDTKVFLFDVKRMKINDKTLHYHPKIKLYFKTNNKLMVGDYWRFYVKLKRIHGLQNPGGNDAERYALQNKILATGVVQLKFPHIKFNINPFYSPLEYSRQILFEHLIVQLPVSLVRHWLIALIMGERYQIPAGDWDILRRTGTNHLMAIAGLHVGIISGGIYAATIFFLKHLPYVAARIPVQYVAASVALFVGCLYSALAGFSIPTQRAAIMLAIGTLFILSQRKMNPWMILSSALLSVLLLNPTVILSDSFWLSFTTIAWIFYCMSGRLSPNSLWWKYGRIQWIIGLGLIPLTLFLFKECSLISFVANTIAIPWLAVFLLPWLLFSTLISFFAPMISHYLFLYCDFSLSILWKILIGLSQLPFSAVHIIIHSYYILFATMVAFIIFLMPRGMKGRGVAMLWLLPLMTYTADKPAYHDVWMTLLDVGQGLSVVVRTKNHVLIYDTGPRFSAYNSGDSIIIPYLKYNHIDQIDIMMISHGDNDHNGGAERVYRALSVSHIKTSVPDKIKYATASMCLAGDTWIWDGVKFEVVYPSKSDLGLGNDSSCVLMIDNGKHRILLTGDIEAYAEEILLDSPRLIQADVLIAPHHGSKTSSTIAFIERVAPRYVLFPVGYRNRYHFPHEIVKNRYSNHHVNSFSTDSDGAIEMKFSQASITSTKYREQNKKYWH